MKSLSKLKEAFSIMRICEPTKIIDDCKIKQAIKSLEKLNEEIKEDSKKDDKK